MIRLENTFTDIARATQRVYEYRLRLKSKLILRMIFSLFYYIRSITMS
jgi:hypothetical protein